MLLRQIHIYIGKMKNNKSLSVACTRHNEQEKRKITLAQNEQFYRYYFFFLAFLVLAF